MASSTAKFNYRRIAEKIATSETGAKRINTVQQKKFLIAKENLIQDFETHPVSQEISSSANAPESDNNLSGTLGGVGNLYSFIGFEEGDRPIEKVKEILQTELKLIHTSREATVKGDNPVVRYRYSVRVPRASLEAATEMQWENRSWLYAISEGISGFSYYLRGRFSNSRSGGGLQAKKNQVRSAEFRPIPYFNKLIRDFIAVFNNL